MKISKKLLASAVAASVMGLSAVAPVAQAEVSASVGISNMYLWRGFDLGLGDASVNGGLEFSTSGFYAGAWAGSGDVASGNEYDLYAGYGGEVGGFSYGISAWTYSYPDIELAPGDLSEVVATIGFGPVALTYYDNISGGSGYTYTTLSLSIEQFGILVGSHKEGMFDTTHVDLSYSYNDNLTFTLSQRVDSDLADDGDALVAVAYSIPLGE